MMTALAHLCVMIVRSRQLEASRRRQTKRLRPGVTGSGSPSDRLKHDVETHAAHAISLYDKTLDERQHTDRAKRKAYPRKCCRSWPAKPATAKRGISATGCSLLQDTLHVDPSPEAADDVSQRLTRTGLQQKPRRGNLSFRAKEYNLPHLSSHIRIQHNLIYPYHSQTSLRTLPVEQNRGTGVFPRALPFSEKSPMGAMVYSRIPHSFFSLRLSRSLRIDASMTRR